MKSKKLIPLFVLFFSLTLLTACGKDEIPSLDERLENQEEQLESFEGVIEGVSKDIYQQGTHQLKTEEEGIIFIESPTIDLNKYIGESVIVQGKIKKGVGTAKPVLNVSKIEYAKVEEEIQEGFKLYENKALGLKFEHPKTWLLEEAGNTIDFSFEEQAIVKITVFSNESTVSSLATSQEDTDAEEVTIAAQNSLRFASGSEITFYIPNPPKKKIYQIKFTPSKGLIKSGEVEKLKAEFYDLLQSLQLIYLSQSQGQICGGEPPVICPEDSFCELDDDSEFAEGVCIPIGSSTDPGSCPLIEAPNDCSEYQIADYGQNGCPIAYECMDETGGHTGTDFIPEEAGFEEGNDLSSPSVSEVTGSYVNSTLGFKMNYPKSWYYVSFGPTDDSQGKVGFANAEFEDLSESQITMTIQEADGGKASKKIDDLYYVFDGPSDLTGVMEEMANSIKEIDMASEY